MENFRETSDRLSALGISLQDQAEALGVQYQTLRSMRAEPGSKSYRQPPEPSSWSLAWARLLRERAAALQVEADRLAGGLNTPGQPTEALPLRMVDILVNGEPFGTFEVRAATEREARQLGLMAAFRAGLKLSGEEVRYLVDGAESFSGES